MSTLTVYPNANADAGKTSCDGYVMGRGSGLTWAQLIVQAGDATNSSATNELGFHVNSDGVSTYARLVRSLFLFDTSALTAGATVTAVTTSIYGKSSFDQDSKAPNLNIYTATTVSNTVLSNGDHNTMGSTALSTSITFAGFNTSGYNNFAENATGIAAVSKTGITKRALRNANYDVAAVNPAMGANHDMYIEVYFADQTGTTNDPKMVVTYTPAVTSDPSQGFFWI